MDELKPTSKRKIKRRLRDVSQPLGQPDFADKALSPGQPGYRTRPLHSGDDSICTNSGVVFSQDENPINTNLWEIEFLAKKENAKKTSKRWRISFLIYTLILITVILLAATFESPELGLVRNLLWAGGAIPGIVYLVRTRRHPSKEESNLIVSLLKLIGESLTYGLEGCVAIILAPVLVPVLILLLLAVGPIAWIIALCDQWLQDHFSESIC